jgi:hypothetical protein
MSCHLMPCHFPPFVVRGPALAAYVIFAVLTPVDVPLDLQATSRQLLHPCAFEGSNECHQMCQINISTDPTPSYWEDIQATSDVPLENLKWHIGSLPPAVARLVAQGDLTATPPPMHIFREPGDRACQGLAINKLYTFDNLCSCSERHARPDAVDPAQHTLVVVTARDRVRS